MPRLVSAARTAVGAAAAALRIPGMARFQAAWLLGFAAEGALIVLLTVVVFGQRGAGGVALLGATRMLASTLFGLLAAEPLARWRPDRVVRGLNVIRGVASAVATIVVASHANVDWLFPVILVMGGAGGLSRPAQNTIMPALARTAEDLVTSNVASSSGEAMGSFLGPILAAACIVAGIPAAAGVLSVVALGIAVVALSGIRFEHQGDDEGPAGQRGGGGLRVAVGIAAIRHRPATGLAIVGFSLQTLVRGLLGTLIVVLSTELLGLGQAGVGYLTAAIGIGGIAGMVAGLALRRSTTRAFAITLAAWGAPIALIGVWPGVGVALAALVIVGLANALLDIVGFTLLQRGCRNEERGAIFAIMEGSVGLGASIGSLLAPVLIALAGTRGALVATGLLLPCAAVILGVLFRRLGHVEVVPAELIERLQRVPAFRVLPLTGLEQLAASAQPIQFAAGEVLMREGEPGDRFILIERGTVDVSARGRQLNVLGAGSGIGEIALLRRAPRSATVTALEDVHALAFDGPSFVAAVSGPAATAAVMEVMEERLARSAAAG